MERSRKEALAELGRACEAAAHAVRAVLTTPPADAEEACRRLDAALDAVAAARRRLDEMERA